MTLYWHCKDAKMTPQWHQNDMKKTLRRLALQSRHEFHRKCKKFRERHENDTKMTRKWHLNDTKKTGITISTWIPSKMQKISRKTPKWHENDTKMTRKWHLNDTKETGTTIWTWIASKMQRISRKTRKWRRNDTKMTRNHLSGREADETGQVFAFGRRQVALLSEAPLQLVRLRFGEQHPPLPLFTTLGKSIFEFLQKLDVDVTSPSWIEFEFISISFIFDSWNDKIDTEIWHLTLRHYLECDFNEF